MEPADWVLPEMTDVLDVGCNVGEHLNVVRKRYPRMQLTGVDVNARAIAEARWRLPSADFRTVEGIQLPFEDSSFDCVLSIEMLEHVPAGLRASSLAEIRRVLRPGGRLILRVPHAGVFAWLDSNNVRFRFPRLYSLLVRRGRRDDGYVEGSDGVVWHHHFTSDELLLLLGHGWELEAQRRGALFLFPLVDFACWPFYRSGRIRNPVFRALQQAARWDVSIDYGAASYDMMMILRRQ